MKLKHINSSPTIYRLQVHGAPRRFIVDRKLAKKLAVHSWNFVPSMARARASVRKGELRIFLHRYVAELCHLKWQEIFFANNDPYDCRKENLRPYRRDEEGARRKMFRGKKVKFKGVYLRKSKTKQYGAAIRINRKLKHLGYFDRPEQAAKAYRDAWRDAHPNLTLN